MWSPYTQSVCLTVFRALEKVRQDHGDGAAPVHGEVTDALTEKGTFEQDLKVRTGQGCSRDRQGELGVSSERKEPGAGAETRSEDRGDCPAGVRRRAQGLSGEGQVGRREARGAHV